MKIIICLMATVAVLAFCGCKFSVGAKKDFGTGLSFTYHGFRVGDMFLTDSGSFAKRSDNNVSLNSRVDILATNISNYTLKDGKVLPGMSIKVTDKDDNEVYSLKDVFSELQGADPQDASALRAFVIIARPMLSGEMYNIKVHVWDKYNSANTIDASAKIVVE